MQKQGAGKTAASRKGSDLERGVSSRMDIAGMSTAECAMDSSGPNQVPMGIKKGKVSTDRGTFKWK